jgi:hypothetical protein
LVSHVSVARRILRGLGIGLALLVGLLALMALAWLASNWRDDAPRPLPAALDIGATGPGSPFFLQLQSLAVPAGAGLKPLACDPDAECAALWTTQAAELERQLEGQAALGQACSAALASGPYVEALPEPLNFQTPLPSYQGMVNCGRWFLGQAVLAAQRDDRAAALQHLREGRDFSHAVSAGARLLIGRMVSARVQRDQYRAIAAVAAWRPAWAAELAALANSLPPMALQAPPWMAVEAAYARGSVDALSAACDQRTEIFGPTDNSPLQAYAASACRHRIGWLPQATKNTLDADWLAQIERVAGGIEAALASGTPAPERPGLRWRNTFGALVLGTVWLPDHYIARQADVELHRQALLLALAAQAVPAAERARWLEGQSRVPPLLRPRITWADNGRTLVARPWSADVAAGPLHAAPIRIALAP